LYLGFTRRHAGPYQWYTASSVRQLNLERARERRERTEVEKMLEQRRQDQAEIERQNQSRPFSQLS